MRNRTVTLLALLLLLLAAGVVCGREKTIHLGGETEWRETLLDNLILTPSGDAVQVMPFRYETDADTEFLLHFDTVPLADSAGNFAISAPHAEISTTTRRSGRASLLVDSPADAFHLSVRNSEYFFPGAEWGSFSLEFWLYPTTLTEGESILSWTGREGVELAFRTQKLDVSLKNRRLRFEFENMFVPPDRSPTHITLEGDAGLIPRRWSHHRVRFDADTGRLEYLVDGLTASVRHVSETGAEDGTVFYPRTAAHPDESIVVAADFTGAIDELRLVRRSTRDPSTQVDGVDTLRWYEPAGGSVETRAIDLGSPGAVLQNLSAEAVVPGRSDIFYYLKVADRRTGESVAGEWEPVLPGPAFRPRTGRFVQIRAELLPDPGMPDSPSLAGLTLSVEPDPVPHPPTRLMAVPGDGTVDLSWSPVLEPDIRGYLVYYGEQPGRYHGSGSDSGPSPIDVGQATGITVTGLDNGTLYYFAVSAYDVSGPTSAMELSVEAAARPAKVYR